MLYILTPVFCAGLCLGAVFSFLNKGNTITASAFDMTYLPGAIKAGGGAELWDAAGGDFNDTVLDDIVDKLFGEDDPVQYIKNNDTEFTATGSYVVPANKINARLSTDYGLTVQLGGMTWMATSLTLADIEDETDNVILTLYLSDVYKPAGSVYPMVVSYYSPDGTTSPVDAVKGNNMYSRSNARSTLLTLEDFKLFSDGNSRYSFANQFLVQPKYINYQQTQTGSNRGYYTCVNDALGSISSGWAGTDNYQPADTYDGYRYDDWGNDYIWLPSLTETGTGDIMNTTCIWKMNYVQRTHNGTYAWLRTGQAGDYRYANYMLPNGASNCDFVSYQRSLRPAIHLNLTSAVLGGYSHTHEFGEWEVTKQPTCTEAGEKTHTCSGEDCTLEDGKETAEIPIDSTAHDWGEWTVKKPATCTATGEKIRVCSYNPAHKETQVIEQLAHVYEDEFTEDIAATCTTAGSKSKHCANCDDKKDVTTIPMLNHDWGEWTNVTAPTCTKSGTQRRACTREGCMVTEERTVTATGHSYEDTVKEPTCTEEGYTSHVCSVCGNEYTDSHVDATGHAYDSPVWRWATNYLTASATFTCSTCNHEYTLNATVRHESATASCTVAGDTTHIATVNLDGTPYTDSKIGRGEKLPHDSELVEIMVEPTCTDEGAGQFKCKNCSEEYTDIIPALGHDFADEFTEDLAATCTTDGSKSKHCSRCSEKDEVTVIEATGHTEEVDEGVEATCTSAGLTEGAHCSVCNTVLTEQTEVPALGHDWGEWEVVRQATFEEAGEKRRDCSRCDEYETQEITDVNATGISASLEEDATFTTASTLEDFKAKLTVKVVYDNGMNEAVTDYELSCEGLRADGKFKAGKQSVTVSYGEFETVIDEVMVSREKVALPAFKSGLKYSGVTVKPTAADFKGYDGELMTFVADKLQSGLAVGSYKAVFALNDPDNFEWATAKTLKKSVFAAAIYDGETQIVLDENEVAVDWSIARAVLTATKTEGGLPVFKSESFKGSLADVIVLRYYKDEACTEEVAAADLGYETQYFVKAELLDTENFELDASAEQYTVKSFSYTTPAKKLVGVEKAIAIVKANWLWIVIAVAALILLILIIAAIARSAKRKREKAELAEQRRIEKEERKEEERRLREEERRREEREERMAARMAQPQIVPQMMPQQTPQSQPAGQPMYMGGGSASDAQLAQIQSELAAMRAEQAAMRTEVAMRAEQAAIKAEQSVMHSEIYAMRGGEQVINGGISLDKLTEIIRTEVRNAMANEKAAAQATPAAPESVPPVTAQVPPDAVMTTVTTTKIDTTKKPAQNAQAQAPVRTVVRNVVAPMPVDDGRVFDVGGFYKPADPMTDIGFTDEDNKD